MDAAFAGLIGAGIGGGFTLAATWLTAGLGAQQAERDRRRGLADHVAHELARIQYEVLQTEDLDPTATRARLSELANELLTLRQTRLYGLAEEEVGYVVDKLVECVDRLAWPGPDGEDQADDRLAPDSDAVDLGTLLMLFRIARRVLSEYVRPTRSPALQRLGRRLRRIRDERETGKFDRRLRKLGVGVGETEES